MSHKLYPDHPLILLTDFSPDAGGGDAVILRNFMDPETRRSIVWVTLTPGGVSATSPTIDERVVVLKGGPKATVPRKRRSIFRDSTTLSRRLAEEVRKIAQEHRARGIWIVMYGATVPIASHLVKHGELPVVATVHDDPAFGVALRSRRYLVLVPLIERAFAQALKGAAGVEVISRGMMERYKNDTELSATWGTGLWPPLLLYLPLSQRMGESCGSEYWATLTHTRHYEFLDVRWLVRPTIWDCAGNLSLSA